jgi:hypothetical protein
MKNKPLYLILFPILSLIVAMSFPLQIHLIYKIPLSDPLKILSMLTPLNLISMAGLILAGAITLFLNKVIYKVVPILLAVVFINNAIVGLYGTDYTLVQVGLSFLLFAFSLKPFYSDDIKAVIMNPKMRWWKTPKRYPMEKSVFINSKDTEIDSEALNFSKTGLYAKIENDKELEKLIIDEIIELKIGIEEIPVQARVVRIVQDTTAFPNGVGLEFIRNENHKNGFIPWFKKQVKTQEETLST